MNKRILVIEDDSQAENIWDALQDEITEVYHATSVLDAHSFFMRHNIALVILHLDITEMDGLRLLQQIHKRNPVPILALSRKPSKEEEVLALSSGADKYLGVPFDADSALANARALMRRYSLDGEKFSGRSPVLEFDFGLKIDLRARRAFWQGNLLNLTTKQYMILVSLASDAGEVVTKEQLYSDVWNENYNVNSDEVLKSHVSGLRKELNKYGAGELIQTVWGTGYQLIYLN